VFFATDCWKLSHPALALLPAAPDLTLFVRTQGLRMNTPGLFGMSCRAVCLAAALVGASSVAVAAENRVQRYTPGLAGSDLTSMLVPGWYGQVALVHYHATKLRGNDGAAFVQQGTSPVPYTAQIKHFRAEAYIAQPRITYLSSARLWGAHLGFTAMLPLIQRATSLSNAQVSAPSFPPAIPAITAGVNNNLALKSGNDYGFGDLELAPVLNWAIGDNQTVTLASTVVLPTGSYDANKPVNVGFGKYYTFRPSIQYGYIADGWDVGVRTILSFNSRNKDNGYKSGNVFNMDFALMKFIDEDVRLGVQGYVVKQFTRDNSSNATAQSDIQVNGGNKLQAYALGPALGWLKNGGEMLVEGKILREFNVRNRAEGTTYMLTVSKPLGL
jgi:hypothetical protein